MTFSLALHCISTDSGDSLTRKTVDTLYAHSMRTETTLHSSVEFCSVRTATDQSSPCTDLRHKRHTMTGNDYVTNGKILYSLNTFIKQYIIQPVLFYFDT